MSEETPDSGFLLGVIEKVAPDSAQVGEWVAEVKKQNPELSQSELADFLGDDIVWTYTKQGAAMALPGMFPGLGTVFQVATEAGAITADIALMMRNQSYLVFALGHVYGFKARETLIQDSLICAGLWSKALQSVKNGIIEVGSKTLEVNFRRRFPKAVLQKINRAVGARIFTKYLAKRGTVSVGRLIPFGVGAVVGGGFNYLTMRSFKESAIRYFELKKAR